MHPRDYGAASDVMFVLIRQLQSCTFISLSVSLNCQVRHA